MGITDGKIYNPYTMEWVLPSEFFDFMKLKKERSMSLTRNQWINMWEEIKKIERLTFSIHTTARKKEEILIEVGKIKGKIQEVIGQME